MEWEIDGEEHSHAVSIKDVEGWYEAYIKWDGCCEVVQHYNTPGGDGDSDQIHICDIPKFIEILQSIEKYRREYFGKQGTLG